MLRQRGNVVWTLGWSLVATMTAVASAGEPAKVTYQDQVGAIFRSRCNSCHNADKQKGGLNLESYGTALQGGSSGKVIEPGDLDGSALYQYVTHQDQPYMPPNSPKLPDAELNTIKLWIEGGALEASGSVAAVKAKPKFEFKLDPSTMGKPVGPPAMPEKLMTEPFVLSTRPNAVIALAASPWAPLVAVAGHKQVLLYQPSSGHLAGVLAFPEGTVHVLKFSRNGSLLLAGGGRGGQSGLVVVWDVKTGKRVFEIGKEYDVVLAADISPDHSQVALGGPSKILRVYSTADGQKLYESKKHTDWVTAVEFSPDGVLLASGDRSNGLVIWEVQTGREFHDLRGHGAAITDITWRLDSNVVASSSEDGTIRLWEMENGGQIKSVNAHGGGVTSVRFAKGGQIVSTGRDRMTRTWDANGAKQREFEAFGDLALKAVWTHDESSIVGGDWSGEVRVWNASDGQRLMNLSANPARLVVRMEKAQKDIAPAEAAAAEAQKGLGPLEAELKAALAAAEKAKQALDVQKKAHESAVNRVKRLKAEVEALAVEKKAQEAAQATAGANSPSPGKS
jgi:WD40 repeat protein